MDSGLRLYLLAFSVFNLAALNHSYLFPGDRMTVGVVPGWIDFCRMSRKQPSDLIEVMLALRLGDCQRCFGHWEGWHWTMMIMMVEDRKEGGWSWGWEMSWGCSNCYLSWSYSVQTYCHSRNSFLFLFWRYNYKLKPNISQWFFIISYPHTKSSDTCLTIHI